MQELGSKLKNDPIRLEEISAKSKQSDIRIVEGGDNAKRNKVVVSSSLEHDEIQADDTNDNEAPKRPIRIHRDCDSSERITIN
ncbi:hypothetical protein KY290_036137 [Solanum tuberosum]|uniref:Uncharacterized protein n=1 Tax=Solanum tuberosum TaxID=4113 RepID=A0ABQ7TTG6_SOLTU|nr:hypothetical protein KY290_036137 [Solanum tuberosum]